MSQHLFAKLGAVVTRRRCPLGLPVVRFGNIQQHIDDMLVLVLRDVPNSPIPILNPQIVAEGLPADVVSDIAERFGLFGLIVLPLHFRAQFLVAQLCLHFLGASQGRLAPNVDVVKEVPGIIEREAETQAHRQRMRDQRNVFGRSSTTATALNSSGRPLASASRPANAISLAGPPPSSMPPETCANCA